MARERAVSHGIVQGRFRFIAQLDRDPGKEPIKRKRHDDDHLHVEDVFIVRSEVEYEVSTP